MSDTAPINVTAAGQSIDLLITGAPDVKNKYGSGHIRPSEVTLTYRDGAICAQVYGRWRRENGELTDASASQNYRSDKGDMDGWPEWLASLAREHRPAIAAPPVDRAALRDRIADAIHSDLIAHRGRLDGGLLGIVPRLAAAVLAVLPEPADRAAEIEQLRKEHAIWRKLGQRNLERAHEENARLRADQAALERIREAVRRLAAHAVGFQDVLDDTDRDPWAKTVGADIAELRRLAAETPQPDTEAPAAGVRHATEAGQ